MLSFYIDSADRDHVARLLATGFFAGVTTNPAILDKSGLGSRDIPAFVEWAVRAGASKVFVQSWGSSVQELVQRGEQFRGLADNVTVKVPASRDGIEAARILADAGEVLVTAVYSASQVLPIIASGATYMAPFVGRMTAAGRDGIAETIAMQCTIDAMDSSLEVLAGSLRAPQQLLELAGAGVKNFTMGPPVWDMFFADELTSASVTQFQELASRPV